MEKDIAKILGKNRKAGVKVGEEVYHPTYGLKTKIVAVYEDLLGNERVLTEYAKKHVEDRVRQERNKWRREARTWGFRNIRQILKSPQLIVYDSLRGAFIFLRRYKGRWAGIVVGEENQQYIYTVQPMSDNLNPRRYITLYERESKE